MMDIPKNIRDIIIQKHRSGESVRQISAEVLVVKSTVHDVISAFCSRGTTSSNRRGRCGRKRTLSVQDERLLQRESLRNPQSTAQCVRKSVGSAALTVSLRTVQMTLKRLGQVARRPLKSPHFTASQ